MTTQTPATEKQINFINTLIAERIDNYTAAIEKFDERLYPVNLKQDFIAALALIQRVQIPTDLSKSDASDLIEFLKQRDAGNELLQAQRGDYYNVLFNRIVALLLANLKPAPAIEQLAEQVKDEDVFNARYLARTEEGELVVCVNKADGRHITHADGRREINAETALMTPLDWETYHAFWSAWARLGRDETQRAKRQAEADSEYHAMTRAGRMVLGS